MSPVHFSCNVENGRDSLFNPSYCSDELKLSIERFVTILLDNQSLIPLYQEASRIHRTVEDFRNNFEAFFEIHKDTYPVSDSVKEDFKNAFTEFVERCEDYQNDKGKLVEHLADVIMQHCYQLRQDSPQFKYEGSLSVEYDSEKITSAPKTIDVCSSDTAFGDFVECKCLISPTWPRDEEKVNSLTDVYQLLQKARASHPHRYQLMILVSHANESKLNFLRNTWAKAPIVSLEEFMSIFAF